MYLFVHIYESPECQTESWYFRNIFILSPIVISILKKSLNVKVLFFLIKNLKHEKCFNMISAKHCRALYFPLNNMVDYIKYNYIVQWNSPKPASLKNRIPLKSEHLDLVRNIPLYMHPWKVIYKECAFSSHPLINMAATGHSCF
jgi:hypothetical protein